MVKKAKHDDMLSNLPDSILSRILSLLPIKNAVSISILSTRWRYLSASLFNLDVNFYLFMRSPPHIVKSFTNFMDKLLFFHAEERIQQFRLNHTYISGIDDSHVCRWIYASLWRGVKELDLVFYNFYNMSMLPTALLFTGTTLVRLKLYMPFVMTVPIYICLPNLKTLELRSIKFEDDDSVKRLFSSCHVLEDLSIFDCDMRNITCLKISNPSLKSLTLVFKYFIMFGLYAIVLDLPSLAYFKYDGHKARNYSMVNMPYLAKADINIYGESGPIEEGLVEFFQQLGNVNSLHLTLEPQALPVLSHKRFDAFGNLLRLQIVNWSNDEWEGAWLLEFLELSPNLQTLVIRKLSKQVSLPMEKVPSCVVYQLKEFKVIDFDEKSSLFNLVTYILKNAALI
ncbi:F-box/LRR-repeat protein At4g14096-like [Hibiscus syriacus]|uniref:F-box/LRR-repeat protein At4g14096-like n=1 Tax=Hibiscus syriacus TaxID=106335 RepID=UPI001922E52F|nr:F-box/LRR-repeat protein At4g14096-like [Hibiscus syriacus]